MLTDEDVVPTNTVVEPVFGAAAPVAGDVVPLEEWIGAQRLREEGRASAAGTIISIESRGGGPATAVGDGVTFDVRGAEYVVSDATLQHVGLADGTAIEVDRERASVRIAERPEGAAVDEVGRLHTGNDLVNRMLYPSRWIEGQTAGNEMRIIYLGSSTVRGETTERYRIEYPGSKKYAAPGWLFEIDARTGILLRYTMTLTADAGGFELSAEVSGARAGSESPAAAPEIPANYQLLVAPSPTSTDVGLRDAGRSEARMSISDVLRKAQEAP